MLVVSGIVTTVFLGGWMLPFGIDPPGWVDPFVVLFKMSLITFLFIWVRATLPRLRYDQFMRLGWKFLVPISLVWIVAVIAVRDVKARYGFSGPMVLVIFGCVIAIALVIAFLVPERKVQDNRVQVTGGGYPVPPLDLSVPKPPRRRPAVRGERARAVAAVSATGPAEQEADHGDV